MILTGDVGGTNLRLALLEPTGEGFKKHAAKTFASGDFACLEDAVSLFLDHTGGSFEQAAIGVAGPVIGNRCGATNLPWVIDGRRLQRRFGFQRIALLNDLEAQAAGIAWLPDHSISVLYEGEERPGNRALIAAGTGLGQAGMYFDGRRHQAFATEGGHADFAPHNEIQIELLRFMTARHGRVSWERLVSGMGLQNLLAFFVEVQGMEPIAELANSPSPSMISQAALEGRCPVADRALDLFVTLYGAEAGNLGLKTLAVNGLYLGGGIAPKILARLRGDGFRRALTAKGRMSPLMELMPVRVIMDGDTALYGAAAMLLD